MGSFLDKPKTEKTNDHGEGNGLRYGLASMQGWRIEMEDSHSAIINLPVKEFKDWSFFAVFDGHAGAKVSQYCSQNLLDSIINTENSYFANKSSNVNNSSVNNSSSLNRSPNSNSNLSSSSSSNLTTTTTNDTTTTTSSTNNTSSNNVSEKIKAAIRQGFLDLDHKISTLPEFKDGDDKSGSTAVACLVSPHYIFLINCGDSRAIVCRDNQVVLKTCDHKPNIPAERDRIQKAGGSVMIQRVNGSLAVSRALGDFEYKLNNDMGQTEQLVSPEPEIFFIERDPKDEFAVLACDGIWDVMTNEDVKDYVRDRLKVTDDLVEISNDVLDSCLYKGSKDNMSIIVVTFPGAPKPSKEDIENDQKLNTKIGEKVKELVSTTPRPDLSTVINMLSNENWQYLPPGGGLSSKHSLIEKIYNELVPKGENEDNIQSDPFSSP